MTSVNLTPLFEAIITVLAAIITTYIVPWIKGKLSEQQMTKIQNWVSIAVYAAEKLYGAGNGAEKLAYAESILRSKGIELDTDELKALIDSEIQQMDLLKEPEISISQED